MGYHDSLYPQLYPHGKFNSSSHVHHIPYVSGCQQCYLVGGLVAIFYFPILIGFLIIPIDELLFFRGVAQPPTSYLLVVKYGLLNTNRPLNFDIMFPAKNSIEFMKKTSQPCRVFLAVRDQRIWLWINSYKIVNTSSTGTSMNPSEILMGTAGKFHGF